MHSGSKLAEEPDLGSSSGRAISPKVPSGLGNAGSGDPADGVGYWVSKGLLLAQCPYRAVRAPKAPGLQTRTAQKSFPIQEANGLHPGVLLLGHRLKRCG